MSTSADVHTNGNGHTNGHEHILRPRAIKPMNPAIRASSDEGLLAPDGIENGTASGQTRLVFSATARQQLIDG